MCYNGIQGKKKGPVGADPYTDWFFSIVFSYYYILFYNPCGCSIIIISHLKIIIQLLNRLSKRKYLNEVIINERKKI